MLSTINTKPIAIVTGGRSRIGYKIAHFLTCEGWEVITHGFSTNNIHEGDNKNIPNHLCGDFRKSSCIKIISDRIKKGDINLIINNAAVMGISPKHPLDEGDVIKINFCTPCSISNSYHLTNESFGSYGHIINILDSDFFNFYENMREYRVSKSALYEYTLHSAKIFAPQTRVNGIALGPIMKADSQSDHHFRKIIKSSPMGIKSEFSELLHGIKFLLESKSITGEIIHLGGGLHLNEF